MRAEAMAHQPCAACNGMPNPWCRPHFAAQWVGKAASEACLSCPLQVAAPFNIPPTPAGCQLPYCTIWRMNKDGSAAEVYATGVPGSWSINEQNA